MNHLCHDIYCMDDKEHLCHDDACYYASLLQQERARRQYAERELAKIKAEFWSQSGPKVVSEESVNQAQTPVLSCDCGVEQSGSSLGS